MLEGGSSLRGLQKQDHLPPPPAPPLSPQKEEAVDAAGEDVGPNAHGSDRRGSVQRDRLRCSQSGLPKPLLMK